jgi:excisionase family DNA binding protein
MERLAFTPAEIAAAAGLSRKAIYRAIETGELRAARVCNGSRLLIPANAAQQWIELNIVTPREPSPPPRSFTRPRPDRPGVLANALRVVEGIGDEA